MDKGFIINVICRGVVWPFWQVRTRSIWSKKPSYKITFFLSFNPCDQEPPVTASADPHRSYYLWRHQLLSSDLCTVKRSFKPYLNEHNSVKGTRKRHISMLHWPENFHENLVLTHLKAFLKTFPTAKIRPNKCPVKEKKNEARKAKKAGRKARAKSQDCWNFAFCAFPNFAS